MNFLDNSKKGAPKAPEAASRSKTAAQQPLEGKIVNSKYRITRKIGAGSFGEVYEGIGNRDKLVAIKFEDQSSAHPQLRHEYKVYRELINCHGFCSVHYFGTQDHWDVMVMDLMGPSLENLFNKCKRRFSLKTVLQIADQMLERIETMHRRLLIHRDIKPDNFVVGTNEQSQYMFCLDFGLSKRYRDPKNLMHIRYRSDKSLTGTPRYASINNHRGIELSRRDDVESIGYILIYFLKGSLPWQGLKAENTKKKYRLIFEKKQNITLVDLCEGLPFQFAEFLMYTRSLSFDQEPDVAKYRKIFKRLYDEKGYSAEPYLWDWDPPATVAAATSGFSSKRKNNPLPDSEFARHGKNYDGMPDGDHGGPY